MNETGSNQSIRYDSTGQADDSGREQHSIQTYVSDMLALERHIAQPLKRQRDMSDVDSYPQAKTVVAQLQTMNDSHVAALDECLKRLGGHPASPVKSAWSAMLGAGAAAIDSVRKTKVSKALRDDYTALNLAAVSYTMLHATCVGLGDTATAGLAKRHLADYARLVMQINQAIPDIVLAELRDDGETVSTTAAETIRQETNEVWRSQSDVVR